MKLINLFIAGAMALTLFGNADTKNEQVTLTIGGKNGVVVHHNNNRIISGDSVYDRETRQSDEAAEAARALAFRNTIAREMPSPGFSANSEAEIIGNSYENCVTYAKRITGINRTVGAGGRGAIQGTTPQIKAILVEKRYVHAAVVESITERGVWVTEANYIKGHIARRLILFNDILGFIYG